MFTFKRVSLLTAVVAICVLWTCLTCGCQHGIAPLWSQAKPETEMNIGPVNYRDSAGSSIKAKKLQGNIGENHFLAEGLETSNQATAIREANVEQMAQANEMTKTAFVGMSNMFSALGVTLTDVIRESRIPEEATIAEAEQLPWWQVLLGALGVGGGGVGAYSLLKNRKLTPVVPPTS